MLYFTIIAYEIYNRLFMSDVIKGCLRHSNPLLSKVDWFLKVFCTTKILTLKNMISLKLTFRSTLGDEIVHTI